jgi:Lrp/AsnC family transcriptional regulator, regulator for asnA, asnC and gidA
MDEQLHHEIDDLDKKILTLIQQNARVPFLEVARECNVSGAAIHQRVQKLVTLGVIKGSHFEFDPKKIGYSTCAYIGIFLEKAGYYNQVMKELMKIPEIIQCNYTTGNYSMFIKVYTRDNEHLKKILADQLQKIEGISRTETLISLEESINRNLPIV